LAPTPSDSHPGEMEREGHQIQEIHHYYKGICKQCIEEKRLNRINSLTN
jgi:Fur family ferric uptake transcriptional regulator/Fur family peroxide stress response transcriptional regulator